MPEPVVPTGGVMAMKMCRGGWTDAELRPADVRNCIRNHRERLPHISAIKPYIQSI